MTADATTSETDEQTTSTETSETEAGDEKSGRSGDLGRMEAALRKANREAEKLRLELKERDDAKLSATEKLTSRLAELERLQGEKDQRIREIQVERAIEKKAVKLGVVDPEAAVLLIDLTKLEFEEDGTPKDAALEAALADLIKRRPYLAGNTGPGSGDGGRRGTSPPAASMSDLIRQGAGFPT